MDFLIADTFSDGLARLTGEEQKLVKTTAFDLQMNPVNPGMQLHRIDKSRDTNFWSARVGRDLRLILHKTDRSMMLCYVGHHDDAYAWAERRKIERHPRTGAAQLVEVRETVREIAIPNYVDQPTPSREAPAVLFRGQSDEQLLSYGVPTEWLGGVRKATEDTICDLCDHLPREAAEALLELATGNTPQVAAVAGTNLNRMVVASPDPSILYQPPLVRNVLDFAHPDARRRFRVMTNAEELGRALEFPWEKWAVFLHPGQREAVERRYNGPARVSGSAGTGKTIVALHRAVFLARTNAGARILLTTFSKTLARFLRLKLSVLTAGDEELASRIDVRTLEEVAEQTHTGAHGTPRIADAAALTRILSGALAKHPSSFSSAFLLGEWTDVVDAWQLETWEAYRDVTRLGRKTRLTGKQREAMWPVFESVRTTLRTEGLKTVPEVFAAAAKLVSQRPPYAFVVVDEAQDVTVAQLRFLAALAGKRPDGLFFTGDLGQQIFQSPFSWRALGVDVRGRSQTLRVNYRTSHQLRRQADRLLPNEIADVDGNAELRRGTVSIFNGPEPVIKTHTSCDAEAAAIAGWIRSMVAGGLRAEEIGVFVRSAAQLPRALEIARCAGLEVTELDRGEEPAPGKVAVSTMHLAKGLEFRTVVVAALDEGVVPLEERLEGVSDHADLEQIYDSERHLLYVACTRARDHLLVSGVAPGSEFLEDLRPKG